LKLLQAADGDVQNAQQGIIYIDEIDKIAKKDENRRLPVFPAKRPQALLKILRAQCNVPPQAAEASAPGITPWIRRTFFLSARGVVGLEKIIEKRQAAFAGIHTDSAPTEHAAQYGIAGASAARHLIRYG